MLPTILLVLAFPVGAVVYIVTGRVLEGMPLPDGAKEFIVLMAPLFVAGLVMLPLLIPYFDKKAKEALAEHARSQAATTPPPDPPGRRPG